MGFPRCQGNSFEHVSGRCLPKVVQAKLAKIHPSVELSKCSCARNIRLSRISPNIRCSSVMNIAEIDQQNFPSPYGFIKPWVTPSMTLASSMIRRWAPARSVARTRSSIRIPTHSWSSDGTCQYLATNPILLARYPQQVGEMGAGKQGRRGSWTSAEWCLTFSSSPKESRS